MDKRFLKRLISNPQSLPLETRLFILIFITAVYAGLFFALYHLPFGESLTALAIVPVAAAAFFFNWWGGLLAGVTLTLLNILLIRLTTPGDLLAWLTGRNPGEAVGLMVVGLLFGYITQLQDRLRRQISEHQKTETALAASLDSLRENEALLRRITDNMLDMVIEVDPNMIIRYASPSSLAVSGYRPDELVGQVMTSFLHPDDIETARGALLNVLTSGQPVEVELRGRHRSGQTRWIAVSGKVALDADGQPAGTVFGIKDIQIRKEAQQTLQVREQELRESEALYKPLFENHHTVMLLIDPFSSEIVDANQAACDFYGYTRQELQGMPIGQINQLTARPLRDALDVASGSEHSHFFFRHRLASGEIRDVEVFTTRVQLPNRELLYSIIQDITESNRIMQAEREQRALAEALRDTSAVLSSTLEPDEVLRRILDNIGQVVPHDGANILLIDSSQVIMQVARSTGYGSEAFARKDSILGKSIFDLPGLRWMAEKGQPLVVPDTRAYPLWVSMPEASWVVSYIGAPMYARGELVGFLNLDSRTPGFFNESFTERLQAFVDQAAVAIVNARLYAAVQQEALTDEVTRTYNRRGLWELGMREFDRAVRFHRALSALMLDIDNFKQVNDTYGHLTGDQVLRILADRCRASIREVDVLGRYGGEEFLILLVENDLETAAQVAERLRQNVEQFPFETSTGRIPITISVGAAAMTSKMRDLNALVQRADEALYAAKARGRNQTVVAEPE